MTVKKGRINRQRLSQLLDGVVVAASEIKSYAQIRVDDRRKRIQLNRTFTFGDGFIKSAEADQRVVAQPLMPRGIVWFELDRPLVLTHRPGEIHVKEIKLAERAARFSHLRIKLKGFECRFLCF